MHQRFVFCPLITGICLAVLVSGSAAESADKTSNEFPVLELIASSVDHPNPHNPFWIATQRLGFATEQEINRALVGAVFAIDLQTKKFKKLLNRDVFDVCFLPKLNRLSFVTVGKHQGVTLFTSSIETNDEREHDFEGSAVFDPAWSPDNRKVVFANLSYDSDLIIADVQTGKIEALGDLGRGRETAGTDGPDWSPDGREVVYSGWDKSSRTKDHDYEPKISRLYRFDLKERKYRRLTGGSYQDRDPAYSPDGSRIVFVSNRSRDFEVWIINRDGSGLRKLTNVAQRGFQVFGKPA